MKANQLVHTSNSETTKSEDGYCEVTITSSVRDYAKFAAQNFARRPELIFRGQRDSRWQVESTFRRLATMMPNHRLDPTRHLENFRLAIRGRRGPYNRELDDDSLWALGRHHGLATPFVDWTRSHWLALYFAFCEYETHSAMRAIYVFDLRTALECSPANPADAIRLVTPNVDDNPRLIAQSGVLLSFPLTMTLEQWVQTHFRSDDRAILVKVLLPTSDDAVEYIVPDMNRMNINHLTLFPDLYGASEYVNSAMRFPDHALTFDAQ